MRQSTQWTVELYEQPDGHSPVQKFIEQQLNRSQAKIFAEFDDLVEFGPMPRGDKFKHLQGKLWELRFRGEDLQFRFFLFAHTGKQITILHGFCKKSRKTPKRELEIALSRLQEYLDRH